MNGLKTDTIINRDALYALRELPEESVHCCVTSPPYYALRDYGLDAQIGREDTPEQYIDRLTEVFRELRRVLRSDGTFWLNIADTYCGTGNKGYHADPKNPKGRNGQAVSIARQAAGCKQKDLIGIPWLLALACLSNLYPSFPLDIPHSSFPCFPCRGRRRTSHSPGTACRSCSVCRNSSFCWNCTCGGLQNSPRRK